MGDFHHMAQSSTATRTKTIRQNWFKDALTILSNQNQIHRKKNIQLLQFLNNQIFIIFTAGGGGAGSVYVRFICNINEYR